MTLHQPKDDNDDQEDRAPPDTREPSHWRDSRTGKRRLNLKRKKNKYMYNLKTYLFSSNNAFIICHDYTSI